MLCVRDDYNLIANDRIINEKKDVKMKTKTIIVIMMLLLCYGIASAAYTSPGWSYGYEIGVARGDNAGDAENLAPLAGVHAQLDLFKFFAVRIGAGYTALHATGDNDLPVNVRTAYSTNTFMADARVLFQPFYAHKFSPFIYAGTGGAKELRHFNEDIIPVFPVGIGVKTALKDGLAIEVAGGYHLFNSDDLDGLPRANDDMNRFTDRRQDGFWGLTVGLVHSAKKPAPPVVYVPPTPAPPVVPKPVPPVFVEPVKKPIVVEPIPIPEPVKLPEVKVPLDDFDDLTVGKKFVFEGILFDTAKYAIIPETAVILERAYVALSANPEVNVIIIGHTDSVGSDASNQILSDNRAASVKNWLVAKGIDAKRIRTIGKGEKEPRATNDTPEGRQLNRRIEFEVVE